MSSVPNIPANLELDHLEAEIGKLSQPIAELRRVAGERRLLRVDGLAGPSSGGGALPIEIDRQRRRLVDGREIATGVAAVICQHVDLATKHLRPMPVREPPVGVASHSSQQELLALHRR